MTGADFAAWLQELHDVRRFGEDDRLGTANLIDDASRARGLEGLSAGAPVSLARALPPDPEVAGAHGGLTLEVSLEPLGAPVMMATDELHIHCHGLHSTHVDALNHLGRDGTWYGGVALDDPAASSVADLAAAGLVTRAVLADVPAVRGTDWVDAGEPVDGADIDAALAAAEATFLPGDALLLCMGRDRYEAVHGPHRATSPGGTAPGAGVGAAEWIADHGASIVAWDFLDAAHPSQPPGAVHMLIWAIGLVLIDNCDFAAARSALAAAGKATGLLVAAPLRLPGATGCTIDPLLLI